jgi:glycosyltransferase involved in cell wall biosynthesis
MKILYLAQLFELADEFDSDRHHFNCKQLVEAGHRVTVITSNLHYKTGKRKYQTRRFKPVKVTRDHIDIYYVYSPLNLHGSYFKRILYYLSYYWFSLPLIRRADAPDLVYAVTPSLSVALLGYFSARRLKAKYVLEVADVWPDVLIEVGFLKNRLLIHLLKKIEMRCYRRAEHIIALTRGIRRNVRQKIPRQEDKVELITNGVNRALFSLDEGAKAKAAQLRQKLGLQDKFVCLYLGAHNLYNALFTVIETAHLLKDDPHIRFVLIGDGDKKAELQQLATEYGLANILFLPPVPRGESPLWLQAADLFLLPNLKGKFYEMNLQNKFFDFLASGRPIVFAGSGESADIVVESGAGKVVEAENFGAMANVIKELASLPTAERGAMGRRGREFVLHHFDRERLFQELKEVLLRDKVRA